jgi:hypothetical protein
MLKHILSQKLSDQNLQKEFCDEILESIRPNEKSGDTESFENLSSQLVHHRISKAIKLTYLASEEKTICAGEYMFICPKVLLWESQSNQFKQKCQITKYSN